MIAPQRTIFDIATFEDGCDFCGGTVVFARVYDDWKIFSRLEPVDPKAGSDYLATWCGSCGPKHRKAHHA